VLGVVVATRQHDCLEHPNTPHTIMEGFARKVSGAGHANVPQVDGVVDMHGVVVGGTQQCIAVQPEGEHKIFPS